MVNGVIPIGNPIHRGEYLVVHLVTEQPPTEHFFYIFRKEGYTGFETTKVETMFRVHTNEQLAEYNALNWCVQNSRATEVVLAEQEAQPLHDWLNGNR
jgi:hypothetical protein